MKTIMKCLALALLMAACAPSTPTPKNSKIWLHRTNTIEKAKHFQYEYAGFEIDVHFIDSLQTFVIEHNTEEASTLTVDQWCRAIKNISNMGIWFDFKNLDHHNRDAALECLTRIRERHQLNGRLYVESSSYEDLKVFREAGFRVSFYIPYFNPYKDDTATCNKHLAVIQKAIDSGVNTISGYEFQYKFIKKAFPNQPKLIWTVSQDSAYLDQVVNNIGSDTLVEVLLLPNTSMDR